MEPLRQCLQSTDTAINVEGAHSINKSIFFDGPSFLLFLLPLPQQRFALVRVCIVVVVGEDITRSLENRYRYLTIDSNSRWIDTMFLESLMN
jgi:hypothetical protein